MSRKGLKKGKGKVQEMCTKIKKSPSDKQF